MADMIVIAVIAVLVGSAGLYIYKAKKKGVKCIGCPDGAACSSRNNGSGCGCGCSGGCGGDCHTDADL